METLNLLTGAGRSTNTKQIPQQAEMNRNLQKEMNGHKRNEMNKNGRTPAETDRNRQKETGAEEEEKFQVLPVMCHVLHEPYQMSCASFHV